jgi:hypothetical protein
MLFLNDDRPTTLELLGRTTGGQVQITNSTGVACPFTEVR